MQAGADINGEAAGTAGQEQLGDYCFCRKKGFRKSGRGCCHKGLEGSKGGAGGGKEGFVYSLSDFTGL